jgi:hypothetical protein
LYSCIDGSTVPATPASPESITRAGEDGIRAAIVAVFVLGVRRRDPGAAVNAVFCLCGTFLPHVVERRYDRSLRPWQRLYAETAMLTHAVGMLGPYDEVWWWDHLTHLHSATVFGSVLYVFARRRGRDPLPDVFVGVVAGGALWEAVEGVTHGLSRRVGLEPVLVSYGRVDTLLDLGFDLLGAALVCVLGDRLLGNLTAED